jgi:hypothetical protein
MVTNVKKLNKENNSIAVRGKYAYPVINNKTELSVQVEEAVDPLEIVTYSWEELETASKIKMNTGQESEYTLFILPWKGRLAEELNTIPTAPIVPLNSYSSRKGDSCYLGWVYWKND